MIDFYLSFLDKIDPGRVLCFRDDLNGVSSSYGTDTLSNRRVLTVSFPTYNMLSKLFTGMDIVLQDPPRHSVIAPGSDDCSYEPCERMLVSSTIQSCFTTVA
jgi:hypothetical protein